MMRKSLLLLLAISFLLVGCKKPVSTSEAPVLIPKPQQMELGNGIFKIDKNTQLYADDTFTIASNFLRNYLQKGAGLTFEDSEESSAAIRIEKVDSMATEGYSLEISEKYIVLKASDAGGAFYGVQTLRQLLPPALERSHTTSIKELSLPVLKITDVPQFAYRGMHLDVSRHFFQKEFIKKYIANIALLKMNYFHWHLTDDQGWRIEILQYPDLTNKGAIRDETLIGHYSDEPQQFDGERYGGFYTQEDIKEIVAFAKEHNVTIIPEIEMPGHAQAAISAYPELGCTADQIPVATKWGVFEAVFCPNQKTFTFLENVLTEVMAIFPGEYIHIGGDEAPKTRWKACSHCQQLITDLDLKDEHGLQSYFITKIEAFVNSKGKKIIGWDEILEGGLAPNATVMSWRGTEGGIEAAKEHHDVIMTPTSHAYFDYYQSDDPNEPLAIGGFLPLQKVYSFNPIPEELTAKEAKYILGAQGNLWTEYIPDEAQLEYMAFPRMLAMSEVVWSGASENLELDYADFLTRVESFMTRLDMLEVNYANHLYTIEGEVVKEKGAVFYKLTTPTKGKEIRYSINGSEAKTYTSPIPITTNANIKAEIYKEEEKVGIPFLDTLQFHKGLRASIGLNVAPHKAYSAGGKNALINGVRGSNSRYGDKEWLGFWGDDVEITIDFDEETEINMVSLRFYNANGQWIYSPNTVHITAKLNDGNIVYSSVEVMPEKERTIVDVVIPTVDLETKSLTIKIPSYGIISEGKQGSGNKAWTFIDEIVIE